MKSKGIIFKKAFGALAVTLILLCTVSAKNEPTAAVGKYVITDTGVTTFYNNAREIPEPKKGKSFFGQDAHYQGNAMVFKDNGDGTVSDLTTGLMWQKSPGDKKTFDDAVKGASKTKLGGYNDWRLPTIKELYSLINFNGSGGRTAGQSIPYIDTNYFDFTYGDESKGERIIDSQYWSATEYVSTTMNNDETVFGVNFADGRIKGYPKFKPGKGKGRSRGKSGQKEDNVMYTIYVRGNTDYGINNFVDNGDGTISDLATGLMWMQVDSGNLKAGKKKDGAMNWEEALEWSENLSYAGYDDWRMPDAKELQSIVDYSRSPDTTGSAAIDPLFSTTAIKDGNNETNYPYFWTGTTHLEGRQKGNQAVYIAFGEGQGYMQMPPGRGSYRLIDVHGAGVQRSDPKTGNPADYPRGHGPQGDVITIYNHVRCVRNIK